MTDDAESPPIACTLDGGSLKDRMVWIADLNARALRTARQDDLRLELEYAPDALADVREMIAREKECCAFMDFDLVEGSRSLQLTITAPEQAREAAEMLFGPFQATTPQPAACGCIGGCGE